MKLGVALTTSVTVEVCTRLPLVPVIVSVYDPVGVVAAVATVKVDDPEPVTEVGLNAPVALVGNPEMLKVTAELKPFRADTVGVKIVLLPWITVCELGVVVTEKVGAALTTSMAVALCVRLPLVPVKVSV